MRSHAPEKNLFIEWRNTEQAIIEKKVNIETVDADPNQYLSKYGSLLKDVVDVHEYDFDSHIYAHPNSHCDYFGDTFAFDMLDSQTKSIYRLDGKHGYAQSQSEIYVSTN